MAFCSWYYVVLNTLKAPVNRDYYRDNAVYKDRQGRNGTNFVQYCKKLLLIIASETLKEILKREEIT